MLSSKTGGNGVVPDFGQTTFGLLYFPNRGVFSISVVLRGLSMVHYALNNSPFWRISRDRTFYAS
jgi:hypothetical protein